MQGQSLATGPVRQARQHMLLPFQSRCPLDLRQSSLPPAACQQPSVGTDYYLVGLGSSWMLTKLSETGVTLGTQIPFNRSQRPKLLCPLINTK